jgi:hypothetical protein
MSIIVLGQMLKRAGCVPQALSKRRGFIAFVSATLFAAFAPGQQVEFEAVAGKPFGVGRIAVNLPESMLPQPLGAEGLALSERDGRVLYPALDIPAFGKIVREVLESDTPLTRGGPVREQVGGILRGIFNRNQRPSVYFLFRGDEPLRITLHARSAIRLVAVPRQAPMAYQALLRQWWRMYARPPQLFEQKPDYPPQVENYLISTLSARLNLRLPEAKQKSPYQELEREIGLNLGTESLRIALEQDRILGSDNWSQPADQALPAALEPPLLEAPAPGGDVQIEPLSLHVPAECFYLRFGSFNNFLWLQDTLDKWGGDAQNLIALRGLDHQTRTRMETQLVLKQTALSRMLGPTVVADVAIIGTDMFFREGAAFGFLFQARNSTILGASFAAQRSERMNAGGVTNDKIRLGDHEVSFMSSPDGTVRSYYAVDGDFHFFTTSLELVKRFYAAGAGRDALGKTEEFRYARSLMSLDRDDTVFLYMSDAFFRNITAPHYRVEMARRLVAVADIELVQLAKLAAAGEGKPGGSVEELIEGSLLPPKFGPLPDGSHVVIDGGDVYDSLRGRRGSFLPVPDVPVSRVASFEADEYNRFADFYRARWGRIDPVIVGLKKTSLSQGREQVTADVLMTPLAPGHFDCLRKYAGPADPLRMAPLAGDLAVFDFVMPNQRVFGALRDFGPPGDIEFGRLLPLGHLRDWLVGYVGTLGEVGVLGFLNIGFPPPDAAGYSVSPIGGWRRQFDHYTVFSFHPQILAEVTPQLRLEEAKRPAQLRVRIDDPTNARIMPLANNWAYWRTRETSLNNLRLLQAMDQQLHVPPESCRQAAEFLLDAKLIDPLGGQYVYRAEGENFGRWTSTILENQPAAGGPLTSKAPEGYLAPPWTWFRGLDLEASMTEKNLSAHAEIIMKMPEKK